jgi:hypothetical protein
MRRTRCRVRIDLFGALFVSIATESQIPSSGIQPPGTLLKVTAMVQKPELPIRATSFTVPRLVLWIAPEDVYPILVDSTTGWMCPTGPPQMEFTISTVPSPFGSALTAFARLAYGRIVASRLYLRRRAWSTETVLGHARPGDLTVEFWSHSPIMDYRC